MRPSVRETANVGYFASQSRCHASDLVREDLFSTRILPGDRQFQAWRDQVACLSEISVDENQAENGFLVEARGYDLGKISIASISSDACSFRRGPDHIQRNGMDHWILSYRSEGNVVSHCGGNTVHVQSGSLRLTFLAYPFGGWTDGGSSISVLVERDHLLPFAAQLDRRNHCILEGITAQIATEFLSSMTKLLPVTTVSEIPIFVETAIIILKGFAGQTESPDLNPSRPILAIRLESVKRYIQENLQSSELEPDDICTAMKLSRRQLYYLFERIGGVSAYVRSCRLKAFHDAIADPAEDRPIYTVAADFGFNDAALFSRQFKAQFGYSPREAREAKRLGYAPLAAPPQSVAEWLGQVRGDN